MTVKDNSFQELHETVGNVVWGDLTIVMGDLNTKVGKDTSNWGDVLGGHGEEVCNENGKRVLQFSNEHNLLISNTLVPTQENPHLYLGV